MRMFGEQHAANYLERTRASFLAAGAHDLDAVMDIFCPASVWDLTRWGLGRHTGPAAIRRFLQDWVGVMDEYMVDLEELRDLGDGVVFAVGVQRSRPAGSRTRLYLRYAPVFVWVDGAISQVTYYRDIDEGRADAEAAACARRPVAAHPEDAHADRAGAALPGL